MSIYLFPAKNGDSILVRYGDTTKSNILIDGGYVDTFNNYIRNVLIEMGEAGESLNHLIITHIDSDHIFGAIALMKENVVKRIVEIKNVWHNTFRHLHQLEDLPYKDDSQTEILLDRILARGFKKNASSDPSGEISARQGTTLGAYILKGDCTWNADFDGKAVCIENRRLIQLDDGSAIFLLSPDKTKLDALKSHWADKLEEYGIKYSKAAAHSYDDAFEMLMSWERKNIFPKENPKASGTTTIETLIQVPQCLDNTPTNGSSIAFVLIIDDKQLLFLGDAHPDLILQSLNEYQPKGVINFDIIKVAHHGSSANTSIELLEKIDSKKYVFTTNGDKDGHPDKVTIARIVARPTSFCRELIFNYKTDNSKFFDKLEWKQKYNYSITYLDQKPYTLIING